ncbi:hypothetical protein [Henriciella marina]|uniref:hypothetical protein n=1 Tax=Henriciella marina TaxID=453851 RepID=UPI00036DDD8D|nr:hypothetical protein [Henriciella marina]
MIDRDFILDTLAALEIWVWPIFLVEVYRLDRYLKAERAKGGSGLVGYSVLKTGRIIITLDVRGDRKPANDWTVFAARTPWEKLDPEARASALMARAGEGIGIIIAATGLGAVLAGQGGLLTGLPHVLVPP